MSDSIFKDSYIYDLLYKEKNYKEEANYVASLLDDHNNFGKKLLEFGSGTAKHAKFLTEMGYSVHGIEYSKEMISKIDNIKGFTCQQGDIANVTINQKFDAVISLFHVMSYQISNNKIEKILENANKHISQGGVFIFDFWFTPAVYKQFPSVKFKKVSNEKIEITRVAEPLVDCRENRVDVTYTFFVKELISNNIKTFKEMHKMRHFSLLEIDLFCKNTGFERVLAKEFLTNNSLTENTWNAIVVLKKNDFYTKNKII